MNQLFVSAALILNKTSPFYYQQLEGTSELQIRSYLHVIKERATYQNILFKFMC